MSKYRIKFYISFFLAFCPIIVPAAGLPVLPPDGQIKSGKLGNGISYYLVANNKGSGKVDFALIQKVGREDEPQAHAGEAVVQARKSINDLPHFHNRSPFSFLHSKSIWPDEDGYVKVSEDATVFRFSGVDSSPSKEMVDSTLLMIFDIIGKGSGPMKEKYIPQNQAVIIAGDIDVATVLGKMNMLSLLVADKKGGLKKPFYNWVKREDLVYKAEAPVASGLASISAEYSFPRTPEENMGTVLPLVSSRYFAELSVILRRRIEKAMRQEDIALASIDFNYRGSGSGSGDEKYRVTINTSEREIKAAASVLAGVLADMDVNGAVSEEYRDAINETMVSFKTSEQYGRISNEDYIKTCASAFLYGSSLASPKTSLDFFTKRTVEDEVSARLFNNFVSAILDKSENLTLICSAEKAVDLKRELLSVFSEAWDKNASESKGISHIANHSDTTGLRPSKSKVKIKSIAEEPVSGGQIWVFSNGIKVIYKQIPSSNRLFHYSWLIKGGYSRIKEIGYMEGAYLPDMFKLYNVAGMPSARFGNMLAANGIKMDCEATVSELFIRGSAPSDRLHLLFKSLLSLVNDRSADVKAFDYYSKCEALRHAYSIAGPEYKALVLDSLISNGVGHKAYKRAEAVPARMQENAEKFYSKAFSRMNDGVLVIVGDMDEAYIKKQLLQYIGGFKTDRASSYRVNLRNTNLAGRAMLSKEGREPSISLSLSAPLNLTAENYMAGIIAGRALHESVAGAAAYFGWRVVSEGYFAMFPEETLNLNLYLSMASSEGLPASMMRQESAEEVLEAVRKAIRAAIAKGIDSKYLASGKAEVSSMFSRWGKDPGFVRYILEHRYAYGKDLINGYEKKLGALTASTVNPILKSLAAGSMAEYLVVKKEAYLIDEAVLSMPLFPEVPDMIPTGNFSYPFGGMKVPLDSVDLKSLESLFAPHHERDTVDYPVKADTLEAQTGLSAPDTLQAAPLSVPDSLKGVPLPAPDSLKGSPLSATDYLNNATFVKAALSPKEIALAEEKKRAGKGVASLFN